MESRRSISYINNCSFWNPVYLETSTWLAHAPFAFWLVSVLQPRSIVELGAVPGYSYFALCQAVKTLNLDSKCLALSASTGARDIDETFRAANLYNSSHYSDFSQIVRQNSYDETPPVEDGTVDFLHIGDRYSSDRVKAIFGQWQGKLSSKAVVLIHSTAEDGRGFGTRRFWAEVSRSYPAFEFTHGGGLGVLGVGKDLPTDLAAFLDDGRDPARAEGIRAVYSRLGQAIEDSFALRQLREAREGEAPRALSEKGRKKMEPRSGPAGERHAELEARLEERERTIAAMERRQRKPSPASARRTRELRTQLEERTRTIAAMKKSLSWRLGAPGRELLRALRRLSPARDRAVEGRRTAPRRARQSNRDAPHVAFVAGHRIQVPGRPTILLCAHAAGNRLFGSERSFQDVLQGLSAMGANVLVAVPSYGNKGYIEEIKKSCFGIIRVEYKWWQKGIDPDEKIVAALQRAFSRYSVDIVHTNTIMVREPLLAAKKANLPSIVHVREIISHDPDLCEFIGESPGEIVNDVVNSADFVFANSNTTARDFEAQRTFVIPNSVDLDAFDIGNNLAAGAVNIGLISSNLEKKGVLEFVEVAKRLQDLPAARFLLIGPDNELIERLRERQRQGEVPPNVIFVGYASSSVDAISQTNIVLSVSRFQESFGRSALEAMAARRPVVAFDWGALPELVSDGENGFVVPFGDIEAAADRLRELCLHPGRIKEMGLAGREIADRDFGPDALVRRLREAYVEVAKASHRALPAIPDLVGAASPKSVSVIIPNYNYATYLEERIKSIAEQSYPIHEIIFLDDASTDESVDLAGGLLERTGIPYRIVTNAGNQGPYRQWARGLQLASGDYVWIAEADDSSDPAFLARSMQYFEDETVRLVYCRSLRVDENGEPLNQNDRHMNDVSPKKWSTNYIELGLREVVDRIAYRNTIPNVSACVFAKGALWPTFQDDIAEFRYCGDWYFYASILREGKIGFVADSLNRFRRHSTSVTVRQGKTVEYLDELLRVRKFICSHFPIHPHQLERMDRFLDGDYRIDGVARNSQSQQARQVTQGILADIAGNRRFAFVTTNNGSSDGGSEMLWQESALKLRALGHDVVVLIKNWSPRPPLFDRLEAAGIRLFFKERNGLEDIVRFNPDLCIVSTSDQDDGVPYFDRFIETGIKYVIVNQLTKEARFWPIRPKVIPGVRRGFQGAARAYFTCANNHDVMESRLETKIPRWGLHFNPFHIDRDKVPPFPSLAGGLHIAMPAKILFIHKGQDLLVDVLKADKWRRRDLVINVYGVGADSEKLAEMVQANDLQGVRFHGRVPDISEIWKANHGIVMPSRMEGLPIMLVSAMISARVPIVTKVGGHAEVIDDGVSGFLAETPSAEALDDAMERAFQARSDWETIGLRARERILSWLPDDPVADFIEKLLIECNVEGAEPGRRAAAANVSAA